MIGSAVLARLLRGGGSAVVIGRGKGRLTAEDRIDRVLRRYEADWQIQLPRPRVLAGDLNAKSAGLSDRQVESLAAIDTVFHCAANLQFLPAAEHPDGEPTRTNVAGTRHVVELALRLRRDRPIHFAHVSTAYVAGLRDGRVLETQRDVGQDWANDYERSKVAAEKIVAEAFGDRATFLRPSIVVDRTGVTPVSGDRTIYGAWAAYRASAGIYGRPRPGAWLRQLGLEGSESKNLVDAGWVADVMTHVLIHPRAAGRTYHLTSTGGVPVSELDATFCQALQTAGVAVAKAGASAGEDTWTEPFLRAFRPYFRNDPDFDLTHTRSLGLEPPPRIDRDYLEELVGRFGGGLKSKAGTGRPTGMNDDDLVLCGVGIRLPGGVRDVAAFERLLLAGESLVGPMPPSRLDRELYFDPGPPRTGRTYTELGGCVEETFDRPEVQSAIDRLGDHDPAHRHLVETVVAAVEATGGLSSIAADRIGVLVGHSGATIRGGPAGLRALLPVVAEYLPDCLPADVKERFIGDPAGDDLNLSAASVAAQLIAQIVGARGRREVVDAACSSSLAAMQHAAVSLRAGSMDVAIVAGATTNGTDNLILFSQSQACSRTGSRPLDESADGLVSCEAYAAVVMTRRSVARAAGWKINGVVDGVGISSDGRGKGLWAPQSDGQRLAIDRAVGEVAVGEVAVGGDRPEAYPTTGGDRPEAYPTVDYVECHATSTAVGDATELETLRGWLGGQNTPTPIGSVKGNLGHALEAAGLVGVIKSLIAFAGDEIAPSIGIGRLTTRFDWQTAPVAVVTERQTQRLNRIGVNAFGIGGLNAHVRLGRAEGRNVQRDLKPQKCEPIAIVSAGAVTAAGDDLAALRRSLTSGQSHRQPPPTDRWPAARIDGRSPIGGFAGDFEFNAQRRRIPPKMARFANPAQWMLLQAAEEAVAAAGGFGDAPGQLPPATTGVIVGCGFGGEFGNDLQVGLRFPELRRRLAAAIEASGSPASAAVLDQFETSVLERYTALMDETGGFTASTLASRLCRQFDLLGGACAVDADEAGGMLALVTAVEQLRGGVVDAMLVAATARNLDRIGFEQLRSRGELADGDADPGVSTGRRIWPGEGASVLVLRRLSDVPAEMRPQIVGWIGGVAEADGTDEDRFAARVDHGGEKIIRGVGHLGAAHAILRIATLSHPAGDPSVSDVWGVSAGGYAAGCRMFAPDVQGQDLTDAILRRRPTMQRTAPVESTVSYPAAAPFPLADVTDNAVLIATDCPVVRLQADSAAELEARLRDLAAGTFAGHPPERFTDGPGHQAALTGDLPSVAAELIQMPGGGVATSGRGWRRTPTTGDRIGWLCPGQGSHGSGTPRGINEDPAAAAFLRRLDQRLVAAGLPPMADCLDQPGDRLGGEVWWTQAWILATGLTLADQCLRRYGRPDVAIGHSFGETAAAWVAGSLDIDAAIEFARRRADAVLLHPGGNQQLLSVAADLSRTVAVLRSASIDHHVTHQNAPGQTVVAVDRDGAAAAAAALSSASIASVTLAVPVAYHTPPLAAAEAHLATALSHFRPRPPACGLLSPLTGRYLAEPSEIFDVLVGQFTRPVGFAATITRARRDGVGLMIETGPSDVLTRLVRATEPSVISLAVDRRGPGGADSRSLIDLAVEAFRPHRAVERMATPVESDEPMPVRLSERPTSRFSVIDVRQARSEPAVVNGSAGPVASSNGPVALNNAPVGLTNGHVNGHANGAAVPAAVAVDEDVEGLAEMMIDLVVDQTGYDRDLIDMDADLEAELGVDSIKRAQLIGELQQHYQLPLPAAGSLRISDFPTLRSIHDDVADRIGKKKSGV